MTEILQDPERVIKTAFKPGDVVKHKDGLHYRILGPMYILRDSIPVTATRYVQLEQGGMRAGEVWTRDAKEMANPDIFTLEFSDDPENPSDGVVSLEREVNQQEPAVGSIIDGCKVVGYGYDVTGYEETHTFSRTLRLELPEDRYGLPRDTVIEMAVPEN